MTNRTKDVTGTHDDTKQAILKYLRRNGVSYLGEILKGLSISYSRGQRCLDELQAEGLVETMTEPPKFKVTE
jgi:predicted ArsR family transcriptional regulator